LDLINAIAHMLKSILALAFALRAIKLTFVRSVRFAHG